MGNNYKQNCELGYYKRHNYHNKGKQKSMDLKLIHTIKKNTRTIITDVVILIIKTTKTQKPTDFQHKTIITVKKVPIIIAEKIARILNRKSLYLWILKTSQP